MHAPRGQVELCEEGVRPDSVGESGCLLASEVYLEGKKTVAEMLKRATAQVRTKGELVQDESNGKFLGDMLSEMETFATWCYKVRAQ